MRLPVFGLMALAATAGLSALIAQTVEGLDIEAVRRRAGGMETEAEAFVAQVKGRGDALREEAAAARDAGMNNLANAPSAGLSDADRGPIDFDELVRGAASNASVAAGDAPQFIVFASLSMPPASLKPLIADTARAGGVVVFRGFPNNSAKAFVDALGQVVGQSELTNVGIDPRLFRAFDVQAVPTFVAVSSTFDLCAGFACRSDVPPYDRLAGNVTVDHALEAIADGRGPGAGVAAVARASLARSRRQ